MSEFSNVFTGTDGFRLIELSTVMGKPLIFTKIEIGKGINTDGGGRTSLIEKQWSAILPESPKSKTLT